MEDLVDNIASFLFTIFIIAVVNIVGLSFVTHGGLCFISVFFCLAFQSIGVALGFLAYEIVQEIAKDFKKWVNA